MEVEEHTKEKRDLELAALRKQIEESDVTGAIVRASRSDDTNNESKGSGKKKKKNSSTGSVPRVMSTKE